LESVELAKNRVLERVRKGGHSILPTIIERRYYRGLKNFFSLYQGEVNSWVIYDNSQPSPEIIVKGVKGHATEIYNNDIWTIIQSHK
jgi:predicted ABC-type ATPase